MQLLLLGTTGYHPSDTRQTACLMLPELGLVLDAGSAFYRVREHLITSTLDIFLSHAHLDHCVGITYLFDVLWEREMERVTVHAETEKIAAIRNHLLDECLFPVRPPCEFADLVESGYELPDDGRLDAFPVAHPGGAIGFRLTWPDRSMAYVTDTTAHPTAAYVDQIRNVDLLVHECYFGDEHPDRAELTGHSCLTPVCQVAAEAEVGLLVLVHINPMELESKPLDLAAAQRVFPNCLIGEDRMIIDF